MIRTQVRLEETQYQELQVLASQRSTTFAQLVRDGVDLVLTSADRKRRWERLWEVVGTCRDGDRADDVSSRHDTYLAEIYAERG